MNRMLREVERLLALLYGKEEARILQPRLLDLMRDHVPDRRLAELSRGGLRLTQSDALLISYGDQVREPGAAPLRTLAEFLDAQASELVSGVHVLPFYPSSSDDGFSVVDYRAVDPALGEWSDVSRLNARFDLMFDAVFNHTSAQGRWFHGFLEGNPRYQDWFITVEDDPDLSQVVRPRALPVLTTYPTATGEQRVWTTFSSDQVDLNVGNPEVLFALLDVLLFYLSKGAKFIRLDAIAYLWKQIGTPCIHLPQTHTVIQLMRAVLDLVAPDVLLITETNVPHQDNVSYFGDGRNEAQLVYNFALPPLVLHTIATGRTETLRTWMASLRLPSDQVTFFNFLASHDGIGVNPVRGILADTEVEALVERALAHGGFVSYKQTQDGSMTPYELNINYFDALSDPASDEPVMLQIKRFLVAHAIMMATPGVPGIYFHSLFGSRGDRDGAEATAIPRRINRQKLLTADLNRELSDPASRRSRVVAGLRSLLQLRRSCAAFHPGGTWEVAAVADPRVFALHRWSPGGDVGMLCLHNVTADRVDGLELDPYEVRWIQSTG
jgi:sucrose phosphorylase